MSTPPSGAERLSIDQGSRVTPLGVSRPEAPPAAAPVCCRGADGFPTARQREGLGDYTLGHHPQRGPTATPDTHLAGERGDVSAEISGHCLEW